VTELAGVCANDAEAIIVAWLSKLRRTSVVRLAGDELPFTLVKEITGTENIEMGTAERVVSVHTLCERTTGISEAAREAQDTHRRMLLLGATLEAFPLADETLVSVDFVRVVESPIWVPYTDEILRKVGRYEIGLMYEDQPDPLGS